MIRARDVLTWAGAGHPPPILLGDSVDEPLTAAAAPPLGAATATGLRQTSVHLPRGSAACFFSDGLIDARAGGGRLGLDRLAELANELGDRLNSSTLLDAVAREASEITDDMAVCVLRPAARPPASPSPLRRVASRSSRSRPGRSRHRSFSGSCGPAVSRPTRRWRR
jgi:Serine phosphatase RsbU, regulator of sigma subunit